LIVEVSDTTLHFDRDVKAKLYARHGVRELWIVDPTCRHSIFSVIRARESTWTDPVSAPESCKFRR
jgi:Uma2 family endonuclease